jgi:hypothetical protein
MLFGRISGEHKYIERVRQVFGRTVTRLVKESGHTSHDLERDTVSGETSSPGDAAQIGIWLAEEGYPEFVDFAERVIRARLLPGQLIRTPPLTPTKDDDRDCHRDLTQRVIGGFTCHELPHGGQGNTTDVTASDLHSLVDAYNHIVLRKPEGLFLLLHFDYDDEYIRIVSKRTEDAVVCVTVNCDTPFFVRIPSWTNMKSVGISVNGRSVPVVMNSIFAQVGTVKCGDTVSVRYNLPSKITKETIGGSIYELHWKGDDVQGIRPNTTFYPFYPDAVDGHGGK